MLLRILIVLSLLALTGFLLLKFFSKLVNLNMLSVMVETFQGRSSTVLLPYFAIGFYIIAFLFLYSCFYLFPRRISHIDENNAGGLLGYNKDENHMVYDPSRGEYVGYFWYDAPFPATKFNEAFEIVSFYKLPSRKYYQSTGPLHWSNSLALLIVGLLFLAGTYFMLYWITQEFVKGNNLPDKISHSSIAHHFSRFLRITPLMALVVFLFLTILFLGWNFKSVKKIKNHYHDLYATDQQNLRKELLDKVSRGDTLKGLVIGGYQWADVQTDRIYEEGVRRPSKQTSYQTGFNYFVEFRDLIRIPVYLTVKSPVALGNVVEASNHSNDKDKILTDFLKEYTFIVNPDYSVSLKTD